MTHALLSTFNLAQSIKMTIKIYSFRIMAQADKPHLQQHIHGKKRYFPYKARPSFLTLRNYCVIDVRM
jgi:hypothetical protein